MKEKLKDIARLIIVLLILLIPLGLISLIYFFRDFVNTLPPILVWGCIIVPVVLLFVLLKLIFKSKMFDKMLSYSNKEYRENYKNRTAKNFKEIEGVTVDRRRYKGETGYYTRRKIIYGVILVLVITAVLVFGINNIDQIRYKNPVLPIFAVIFCLILAIYNYFIRMVIISPKGVRSMTIKGGQFIAWEDIKSIGITSCTGNSKIGIAGYIHISKKKIGKHTFITEDAKGTITIKPRNKIIHHLICYWDGEIDNLENVKRWRRYISYL